MLKAYITVALATIQFAAFGELVVETQPKSKVPSNTHIVIGINGVDSVNTAITDLAVMKTNVYTKSQSDAKFQPIGNYLELDADGMIPGSKVKMGTDSWAEQSSPNDNADGVSCIYFTARGIGAYDGVYLTSLTFRTRTTHSVLQQDICLGIYEISNNVQLAYSDLVLVRSLNTDYTFTLVKPLLLDGSKTYRVLFRNTLDASAPNVSTEIALVTNASNNLDSYVGTIYEDRPLYKNKRAVLKASWYVPATLDAMKGLIESMTE